MQNNKATSAEKTAAPVYLAAAAINNLLLLLPAGTDYFLGIVLIVMMTGRLIATRGSLARAVYPLVLHLRWGWHRCERALARGQFAMDQLFESAFHWCLRELDAELVCLGDHQRQVQALDTSTIARFRATKKLGEEVGCGGQRLLGPRPARRPRQHCRDRQQRGLDQRPAPGAGAAHALRRELRKSRRAIVPGVATVPGAAPVGG